MTPLIGSMMTQVMNLAYLLQNASETSTFGLSQDFWEKAAIAVVAAVLAFIFSYLLWRIQQRREPKKQISYDVETRKGLVTVEESIKEKISLVYGARVIRDPHYVRCDVENTGNTVVKGQYIRFEFAGGAEVVDEFFDPEPEREIGAQVAPQPDLSVNERRYCIDHLEKDQRVGLRFIISGPNFRTTRLHPFNEAGDVEFVPRSVSITQDQEQQVLQFVLLFILFIMVPPVFSILPFDLGPMASAVLRLGLLVLIIPYLKPFATVVGQLIVRLASRDTDFAETRVDLQSSRVENLIVGDRSSIEQGSSRREQQALEAPPMGE